MKPPVATDLMHIQTITVDRVFSVCRHQASWGAWTAFGFESAGLKVLEARVYGHPPLACGTTLALAMPRQDDWKNICGWKDLATGNVVVEAATRGLLPSLTLWVMFVVALVAVHVLGSQPFLPAQHIGMWGGLVAVTLPCLLWIRHGRRKALARRALAATLSPAAPGRPHDIQP